jgi:outer membrane protein assembly factor BamB
MEFASRTTMQTTVFGILLSSVWVYGADWPNWRGPNHDGISPETGFRKTWNTPPKVLWEQKIGSAFSSFACVGGKVYTCGTQDKQQVLFCFEADTGKVVWKLPFEKELKEGQGGDGTRATPTVNEGRVYLLGAYGLLVCLDAEKGTEVWKRKFNNKPQWSYAGSVLIEGDLAIVSPGKADGALLALDKKTGKELWKCADDVAGYATPYPFTYKNKRYIAGFMAKAVVVADAKTGREVLRQPWETDYDVNASSPIFHEGYLFITSGYSTGCALFKLDEAGDKLSAKEVWRSKVLKNRFQSCVLKDGNLYGGDQDAIKCVEFLTGKELWSIPREKNATVILAEDHLVVFTETGRLLIAKCTPKEFKPQAEADVLSGRCWTIPVLYGGRLYARNFEKGVCVDLRP